MLKAHELIKQTYQNKLSVQLPDESSASNRLDITVEIRRDDRYVSVYLLYKLYSVILCRNLPLNVIWQSLENIKQLRLCCVCLFVNMFFFMQVDLFQFL